MAFYTRKSTQNYQLINFFGLYTFLYKFFTQLKHRKILEFQSVIQPVLHILHRPYYNYYLI